MSEINREKIDPESLSLRARPRPVTRLNRNVLMMGGAVIGSLILVGTMWALRPPKSREAEPAERGPVTSVQRAEGWAALPADYTQIPKLGPPLGELGHPIRQLEEAVDAPPLPDRATFTHDPEEDTHRAERLNAHAEAEAAAKASIFFKLSERRGSSSAWPQESANADAEVPTVERLMPTPEPRTVDPNAQSHKRAFLQATATEPRSRRGETMAAGPTYAIKAGDTIPAALITRINSDLPGTVTATVTENIYDSDTGQHLLIPQGSTLVGRYDSEVTFGQSRVLLVWTQLVMEHRPTLMLDPLPATDAMGQSGLNDRVDWHWKRIVAGAALSTLIGVAAELASPDRATDADGRVVVAARDSVHETTNEVAQQITRRSLDIQPTLSIREGYPLRVMLNTDLMLPAYETRRPR